MGRNRKPEVKIDTNSWMTTYTDLMILLLTFFVLLLSLSSIDQRKKRQALDSLVGAFGFKPGGHSILGTPDGLNITVTSTPMTPEDIDFEILRNVALTHSLDADLTITHELERTVLAMDGRFLFDYKSHDLKEEGKKVLSDLAKVFETGPRLIELRGYVDPSELLKEDDAFKFKTILSSKRAIAVFDYLMSEGIPPETMVVHGFGLKETRVDRSPRKSYLNRQVEIILDYREIIPHRIRVPKRSSSFLDFKGFFFRGSGDD